MDGTAAGLQNLKGGGGGGGGKEKFEERERKKEIQKW